MKKGFVFLLFCFLNIGFSNGLGDSGLILESKNNNVSTLRYLGNENIVKNVEGKKIILDPYDTNLEYHD
ncbi:MAG: hypothetical protein CMG46_01220, partial [Candidatus Marinimicrobia bacterium]|nr:hypothetical protein [Candidatus Neomarinimicrobiota bacterium]